MLLGLDTLDPDELLTLVGDGLGLLLIAHDVELVTCARRSVETENRNRRRWPGLLHLLSSLVEHGLHTTVVASAQHHVACVEGSILDKHGGQIAAALVQRGLDHGSDGVLVRIGLEIKKVSLKENLLKKFVHVESLLGGDLLALVFSTPRLREDIHLRQLLIDLLRLRSWLVYLVDGKHHRYTGGLGVVDGLDCLRHHRVIGGDDDDGEVGQLGSTGSHGGERLVARGVQERDAPSVRKFHVVGTDVLRDTSGLSGDHVGFTNIVEQRCLTVVNVTHHRDDRRPWDEILLTVNLFAAALDLLCQVSRDELDLVAELLGDKHKRLGVKPLVDGHHQTKLHASLDDLVDRSIVHECGEVVHGHELSDLEDLLLRHLMCHLLLCLGCGLLPLLLSVLGSEVVLLVVVHPGVGLFDLLLDLFLHRLLLLLGHGRLETVRAAVAFLVALALLLSLLGVLVLVFVLL